MREALLESKLLLIIHQFMKFSEFIGILKSSTERTHRRNVLSQ